MLSHSQPFAQDNWSSATCKQIDVWWGSATLRNADICIYIYIYIHKPLSVCWSQLHRITALGMWLEIPWIETSLDTETRSMIQNSFIEYIYIYMNIYVYIFFYVDSCPGTAQGWYSTNQKKILWIPMVHPSVSNRTKLSSTRPLRLRHTSQLLLLLGTFLVGGRLPKLTLHGAWVPWSALNGMDGQKHSCIMHANNLEFRTCFSFNPLPKFSGWEAKQKM